MPRCACARPLSPVRPYKHPCTRMGDLHHQYAKSRSLVITYKGGPTHPYLKLKKRVVVARFVLVSFAFALAEAFEGFAHYHPLVSFVHPSASFLLFGEGLGGTLA